MPRYARRSRLADFPAAMYAPRRPALLRELPPGVAQDCERAPMGRLVDFLRDPVTDELVPVWAVYSRCGKDWEGSADVVTHTCPGFGGVEVRLPKELRLRATAMGDCTVDGEECPEVTLTYNGTRWVGDLSLSEGTAHLEFYCTFDGINVHYWLEGSGCVYPGAQPMNPSCDHPPTWTGIAGSFFSGCCGAIPTPGILTVRGRIRPYKPGRLADFTAEKPVWLVEEECPESCPEVNGCCAGTPLDDQLEYTIYGVGCGCGSAIFASPRGLDGCVTFGFAGCSTSITICLVCNGYLPGRRWENYRLRVGTTLYPPDSGSCNPLSLTFTNISATLDVGPYGTCVGTFNVTVTRP